MVVSDVAGAVQVLRSTFCATGDIPDGRPAEIGIGDSLVMVTPAGERDLFPALIYVYVADADESYRRAVAAGAETLEAASRLLYFEHEPVDRKAGDAEQ